MSPVLLASTPSVSSVGVGPIRPWLQEREAVTMWHVLVRSCFCLNYKETEKSRRPGQVHSWKGEPKLQTKPGMERRAVPSPFPLWAPWVQRWPPAPGEPLPRDRRARSQGFTLRCLSYNNSFPSIEGGVKLVGKIEYASCTLTETVLTETQDLIVLSIQNVQWIVMHL